jgi:predicted RNA-binding protein with PUA-like domain
VDIGFVERFAAPVTLQSIKAEKRLKDMVLVNNSRLSVQPVSESEYERVCAMAGAKRS